MNASVGQLRFSPLETKFEEEEKRKTTVMENIGDHLLWQPKEENWVDVEVFRELSWIIYFKSFN